MIDVDRGEAADAARFHWLLDGNGYFMEEWGLAGPYLKIGNAFDLKGEQDRARLEIDKQRYGEALERGVDTAIIAKCPCRETISVKCTIPADLAHDGVAYLKDCPIDKCIAPIVKALEEGGVMMAGSCCGHGKSDGEILLQDGRKLVIMEAQDGENRPRQDAQAA